MVREMITLPLRIGVDVTRLGLHVAGQAFTIGLRATERLIDVAVPRPGGRPATAGEGSGSLRVEVEVAPPPPPPPASPPLADGAALHPTTEAPPAAPEPPTAPPPTHVSEEPELVGTFADPGAEDGAGAAVHVEEPWKGYAHMTADDVIAHLADASREELAAVELYERAHRARKTVMAAADRQLRQAGAHARASRSD
jgi:hypothetical protein